MPALLSKIRTALGAWFLDPRRWWNGSQEPNPRSELSDLIRNIEPLDTPLTGALAGGVAQSPYGPLPYRRENWKAEPITEAARSAEKWASEGVTFGKRRGPLQPDSSEGWNQHSPQARWAAAETLSAMGYVWRGGVRWSPPIGPEPRWDLVDSANRIALHWEKECLNRDDMIEILDSKRLDLEARLAVAEKRADVREIPQLELIEARGTATNAVFRMTAEMERADTLAAAIDYVLWICEGENDISATYWLKEWAEGNETADKELRDWRAERDRTRAPRAEPELHRSPILGRDEMSAMPVGVGHQRPLPTPVQPAGAAPVAPAVSGSAASPEMVEVRAAWVLWARECERAECRLAGTCTIEPGTLCESPAALRP